MTQETNEATKPVYKRWWFIVLAIFVALIALGSLGDGAEEQPADTTLAAAEDESTTTTEGDTTTTEGDTTTTTEQVTTTVPTTTTTTTAPTTTTTEPGWETYTVDGSGDDVIDFAVPNDEPAVLELSHSGSSNFAIVSYSSTGARLDLLVNEIGRYEGAVPVNFSSGDEVGELEITADGPWSITVRPLFDSPSFESSYEGSGSDVLLYTGTDSRLAISHDGESNFIVMGWTATSRDLLVNEIGAYAGTVRIDPSTLVITVEADGTWTLQTE